METSDTAGYPRNGRPTRSRPLCSLLGICTEPNRRARVMAFGWIVRGRGVTALEDQRLILVVEDDQEIQSIVEDALTDGGYVPAIAPSGEEAVTLLKGNRGKYRALIADIGLRGRMTGWEVASCAREIDPEFPVLYLTGAFAHQWALRGVSYSLLLTKPFAPAQLVTAVSQLLNGGAPTT